MEPIDPFHVPAPLINPGRIVLGEQARIVILEAAARARRRQERKICAKCRYGRRFRNHVPLGKRIKVRTATQRARAITRQAIEVRRFSAILGLFRGFFQALRADPGVKKLAVPRGTYHSATRKGPGRRPLHPRTAPIAPTNGAKWLPRGFPRGY